MRLDSYNQKAGAASRRRQFEIVKRDSANETPTAKQHRLIIGIVRSFVKEYPEDALQIMKELAPEYK